MPKERRDRSLSTSKPTFSPYQCSTSQTKRTPVNNPLENEKNLKEWEDARCPVCMEHPHNAVLLLCSSHKNGCRPYMCDTSYRHSNCFDQFRKSFSDGILSEQSQSQPLTRNDEKSKLACPLCRGEVTGWVVIDPARLFMNTKTRTCACETCDFSGTYTDLRKHARLVHPFVRPSEVDPAREQDWRRMERQRDLGDLLSTLRSSISEEQDEDSVRDSSSADGHWLTVLFLIRVFQPRSSSGPMNFPTRSRVMLRRRPRTSLWGEGYDGEVRAGNVDSGSSDGESGLGMMNHSLSPRQPSPDSDDES